MKKSLFISNSKSTDIIQTNEIIFCKAEGSYSILQFSDNRQITVSKNLLWVEQHLCSTTFTRTHRSFLVNLFFVCKIFHIENKLMLCNGICIPISRARKKLLWEKIEKLNS